MTRIILDDAREPQDFLELVERMKRGRLKVYLGYAAGVGKTFQMLRESHQLMVRRIDVVLGYIETHNREETAELIEGLETVPRRSTIYRNVKIEEMDVDAILARKPEIAIVDEVAHTNAPGSKNRYRYQDILEILESGINVICAFNIQHLESLNDLVERATDVRVRETVPDQFLKYADQIVTLDLSVEDLHERLQGGKIYAADKIPWAMEHFFKRENLLTLRELVLREVAENLERQTAAESDSRNENDPRRKENAPKVREGRVMVCTASHSPRAKTLIRRGSRMAGRLNTHWFLVYVETPQESPQRIDSTVQRRLHENMEIARELGAEIIHLKSNSPVTAIMEFAKSHNVGHIIVGRSQQPWWKRVLGLSMLERLIQAAEGIDIYIVAFDEE